MRSVKANGFSQLVTFLTKLEQAHIAYALAHPQDEAVMVTVAIPGERWEIEFFEDGSIEVERFRSSGEIDGEAALAELFRCYSDTEPSLALTN